MQSQNLLNPLVVLEIGSGTGCIALLLAALCSKGTVEITSIDVDPRANSLALENAAACQSQMVNSVNFVIADVFDDRNPWIRDLNFDLIVSNPPYISDSEFEHLPRSVQAWEAKEALVGTLSNPDGLRFYYRLAELAARCPFPDIELHTPRAAVEVGFQQAASVAEIFRQYGLKTNSQRDFAGKERVVMASFSMPS